MCQLAQDSPSLITNSVPFNSEEFLSLHNKSYGHYAVRNQDSGQE